MKKILQRIFGRKQRNENQILKADSKNRISQIDRNMSEGARETFNEIRDHSKWGNKQLWGSHEKGRGKFGHKTPKKHKH